MKCQGRLDESQSGVKTAAAAKSLQSYPTLCNPIDGSPLGSHVPGILQAKTLEWVAISFSGVKIMGREISTTSDMQMTPH